MTDKRDEDTAGKQSGVGETPEPKSGAGYGNDAEELQKGDGSQSLGEEKSV